MAWTIQRLQESFDLTDREALTIIAIARGRLYPYDYPNHPWWKGAMSRWRYTMPTRQEHKILCRMGAIDAILRTCGVECLEGNLSYEDRDPYWGNTIALYCNAGHSEGATILYNVEADKYTITSWLDFVEGREAKPDYSGDGHFGCDHGNL
jgi:hypothetical protein